MFGRMDQINHPDYDSFLRFQDRLSGSNLNPSLLECLLEMFSSGFLYTNEVNEILNFFIEKNQEFKDFDLDFPQLNSNLNRKAQFMNYLNAKKFPISTLKEIMYRNKDQV